MVFVPVTPFGGNMTRPIIPCGLNMSYNSFVCVFAGRFLTSMIVFDRLIIG